MERCAESRGILRRAGTSTIVTLGIAIGLSESKSWAYRPPAGAGVNQLDAGRPEAPSADPTARKTTVEASISPQSAAAEQHTGSTRPSAATQPAVSTQPTPRVIPPEPDPVALYESLYGAETRKVEATPVSRDDRDLGRKLFSAARIAHGTPKLQRLLYTKVATLCGRDADGATTAVAAVSALRDLEPADADAWDERVIAMLDKTVRQADAADRPLLSFSLRCALQRAADRKALSGSVSEAQGLAKRAGEQLRLFPTGLGDQADQDDLSRAIADRTKYDKRVTEIIGRLQARMNVDPQTLDELQHMLVAVVARPGDLKMLGNLTGDSTIKALADIADEPREKLLPQQTVWLADWCRTAANRAQPHLRDDLLRYAAALYADHLIASPYDDPDRVRVRLASRQVLDDLAASEAAAPAEASTRRWGCERLRGPSFESLAIVEPSRHSLGGVWKQDAQGLLGDAPALATHPAVLPIPAWPGTEYEAAVRLTSRGATSAGVALPVGSSSAVLVREGTGLVLANAAGGPVTLGGVLAEFTRDPDPHIVHAKVTYREGIARLTVLYDGAEAGRWEGRCDELVPLPGVAHSPASAPKLLVRGGSAVFSQVAFLSAGGGPRWLHLPGAADIGWDGTPPRDLIADRPTPTSQRFLHHGAAFTIDPALPGGAALTVTDPSEPVRQLRVGYQRMMANANNLAPLGIAYPRYKRLLAMAAELPRPASDAEMARLRELVRQRDTAGVANEARWKADWMLALTLHTIAERQRAATTTWAQMLARSLSPAELALAHKFSGAP
jgi:hypothetical protein